MDQLLDRATTSSARPINDVNYTTPCTDNPVVFGNFTTDLEDSNNTCTVMGTDAGTQLINGIQVTYDFTSTLVYTNAAAGEGTQIQANVTITRASRRPRPARASTWPSVCGRLPSATWTTTATRFHRASR